MHRYLVFILLLCTTQIHAEEAKIHATGHGIGLAGGATSGFGIAYRTFYENGLGFQATLGAFGTSKYFDMFSGVQMLYTFHQSSPNLRFYVLVGVGSVLQSFSELNLVPGMGIGTEFNLYKNLAMAFDISLAPMISIRKKSPLDYIPLPFPGLAIVYYI